MLLRHSSKDVRHRGEYKKLPNHVEAFDAEGKSLGVVFRTTSPLETPWRMQELVAWTGESLEAGLWHPLPVVAIFVVRFLAIHPFQDGNGRLSRVLTTLLLLRARIWLCALQLAGKRDRGQQGGLLPVAAPDAGDIDRKKSGLGTLGAVLPACLAAAESAPGTESRPRAGVGDSPPHTLGADTRDSPRTRARDDRTDRGSDRGKPKHDKGASECTGSGRNTGAVRSGTLHLVCTSLSNGPWDRAIPTADDCFLIGLFQAQRQ